MEDWVQRVAGILGFARGAVLVLVDHARIDHLRALLVGLEPIAGEVPVVLEPWELEELPHGATAVYEPLPEHARELNAARPLFADRGLRVILWCSAETSAELATGAPDFFDWVSHRVECPGGAATFFLEGLEIAKKVGVGGVIAVFSSGEVAVEPGLEDAASVECIFANESGLTLMDVRLARALDPSRPLFVMMEKMEDTPIHEPGWWTLIVEPYENLHQAYAAARGVLTARQVGALRGESEAIAVAARLAQVHELPSDDLLDDRLLLESALRSDLIFEDELLLGVAPAPLLRGAFARPGAQNLGALPQRIIARAEAGWKAIFAPEALIDDPSLHTAGDRLYRLEALLRLGDAVPPAYVQDALEFAREVHDPVVRSRIITDLSFDDPDERTVLPLAERVHRSIDLGDFATAERLSRFLDVERWRNDLGAFLYVLAQRVSVLSAMGRYASASLLSRHAALQNPASAGAATFGVIRVEVELGLNAARRHQRAGVEAALDAIGKIVGSHLLLQPDELPETIALRAALHWMGGQLDDVERDLHHPQARSLGPFLSVQRGNVRWLQGRSLEGLAFLDVLGDPARHLLPLRAEIALARARCSIDAGDAASAATQLTELLPAVERGLGPSCHLAAQLHLTLGEAHLALGSYAQARDAYDRALAILRGTPDYTDLPDRWNAELARALLPSETSLPAAEAAFASLAARIGAEHPLTHRWLLRLDAGRARAARS